MAVPLVLLLLMAVIGSADGAYYHTYKFALFRQPSARAETVTHILRAFSLAVGVWILAHYKPVGAWFWAVAALFLFDLVDDVVDVAIEPRSRAPLGGLPPLEYLIHIVVVACSGGAWATFGLLGWASRNEPAALLDAALPTALVWFANVVVVGAVLTGLGDLTRLALSVRSDGWRPAAPR